MLHLNMKLNGYLLHVHIQYFIYLKKIYICFNKLTTDNLYYIPVSSARRWTETCHFTTRLQTIASPRMLRKISTSLQKMSLDSIVSISIVVKMPPSSLQTEGTCPRNMRNRPEKSFIKLLNFLMFCLLRLFSSPSNLPLDTV